MAVWTIAADEGTGAARVASGLARGAGVTLLDRAALAELVHAIDPDLSTRELEERVGGKLDLLALSVAMSTGSAEAYRELRLRKTLPDLGRTVLEKAAREPCVILAAAAFAVLRDHPAAVHVRLRAPLEWRISAYRHEHLVDRRRAESEVKHDDRVKRAWVDSLFHLDLDDPRAFTIVLDVSRLSEDRVIETLLTAGGVAGAVR
jgi:hypothetical protein